MKITIKSLAVLALAALSAVSCQKETAQDKESVSGKRIEVSVTGLMGEYQAADATKSEMMNVVRVSWADGDIVYAYSKTKGCLGGLEADIEDEDGRYAKLSGTIDDPEGEPITLVYSPLLGTDNKDNVIKEGTIIFDLSKQDGEKVPFVVYGALDASGQISNRIIPFKLATSVMKVNCTGLAEEKGIMRANLGCVNTICKMKLLDDGDVDVTGSVKSSIVRSGEGAFKTEDTRAIFQVAVVETGEAQRTADALSYRTLTVTQPDTTAFFVTDFADDEFETGKAYNSVYSMKDYSYVKIGGKKWSRINLGSGSINGYGDLYSWGETSAKENYSQSKYMASSISSNLTAEQDAAAVNLGSFWHMPAKDDFEALYAACGGTGPIKTDMVSISDSDINDGKVNQGIYLLEENQQVLQGIEELEEINVAGILFSDGNGNTLFFPATRHANSTSRDATSLFGYYWSSTYCDSNNAYYMFLDFDQTITIPGTFYTDRTKGHSIRPIFGGEDL